MIKKEKNKSAKNGIFLQLCNFLNIYKWLFVFALFVFSLDQASKQYIVTVLPWVNDYGIYDISMAGSANGPITIIDNFFYIVHIGNTGAAWGMFDGQTYLLLSIAIIALVTIFLSRKQLGLDKTYMQIIFGSIIGGIIGNVFDRLFRGHVVDFLDFHLPIINYRWPAFNIADCGICIGVCLYIIYTLFSKDQNGNSSANLKK